MQYKLNNNITLIDINNTYKELINYNFISLPLKAKLEFICNNIRINYNDNISIKKDKVYNFIIDNKLNYYVKDDIVFKINDIFLNDLIIKLLTLLIFECPYLLK